MIYTSITTTDADAIESILALHSNGVNCIELDCTYSTGNIYKNLHFQPTVKTDIAPVNDSVIQANAESLPFDDSLFSTILFDPPFLATSGPSLLEDNDSNKMAKRFSVYPDEKSLHTFYHNALKELYRVLKPNGLLIVKCQDKVSSGTQYMSHVFIINTAESIGYYTKDLIILTSKNRMVPKKHSNQKHVRKFHCYYLAFIKSDKKVRYT